MHTLRRLPLVVALLLIAACGDSPTEPKIPSASGAWTGASGGLVMNATLSEADDGSVTGSGSLTAGSESIAITMTGSHAHPNISLTILASGYEDLNFQGRFTDDNTISGTLHGSGFAGEPITVQRR